MLCDDLDGWDGGGGGRESKREKIYMYAAAAKLLQSCPTLCDPMDSSPPGSSVHRILEARILEWVAISFSHIYVYMCTYSRGFPGVSLGKESACSAGDSCSVRGLRRSPAGGPGSPLQYSCLEIPMYRGAWRATVHKVAESDTTEVT